MVVVEGKASTAFIMVGLRLGLREREKKRRSGMHRKR
jgi:hypothetical protein